MHPVIPYVIAAVLFGIGVYGVLVRRNAVLVLMAVELMLNAVNLVLVTADVTLRQYTGQTFALFVIVLAAAEIGVGLALVLQLYRLRRSIVTDDVAVDYDVAVDNPVDNSVDNAADREAAR
ncbi:NADH-quinone oxidoreductase subunit NuoK [Longispora albida]|uniref:NADH-quinone oxidoreductase subunit NuoK n=1 Tax=Longispora albida TaxID=203523 RepID=UPI00037566D6|nr:NADH-quinone oxidoreductase subunit NuoK [Longispora albida]